MIFLEYMVFGFNVFYCYDINGDGYLMLVDLVFVLC